MCLGIPGKIVEIWDEPSGARMAHVEFPLATMTEYGVFGDSPTIPAAG